MSMHNYLLQEVKCKEHPIDDLQVSIGKNSWYLKLPLSACRNLLAEDYGYRVHAFSCKCGSERVFISGKEIEHMCYRCRECGNGLYLDASNVERYEKETLRIDANVVCAIEEKNASIRMYIEIPVDVELAAGEKICYEKKKIAEITVTLNRDIEMRYVGREKVAGDVIQRMESVLWRYIVKHYFHMNETVCHHVVHMSVTQLREAVSRLLRYSELKHSEFLFWVMDDEFYHNGGAYKQPMVFLSHICNHRVEKSVKRALYERYRRELERGKFSPLTPYIVCRAFVDSNYVVRLLKQQEFVLTRDYNYQSIALKAAIHLRFIDFLKERYGEKRLVGMFERMGQDCSYWEDSVEMYANLFARESIENSFLTVRADVRVIHDELIRCVNIARQSPATVVFEYTKAQTKPCGICQDRFEIVLPQDSRELYLWAKKLHNCLHGYVDMIRNRQSTVYGVKENSVLRYAVEIRNGRLVQLRGAYNVTPDDTVRKILYVWYQDYVELGNQ